MLRKILIGTAIAIALLIVTGIGTGLYFMHRYESRWEQESREQMRKLEPRVIAGEGQFKRRLFYSGSDLGEVTQILVGWPADREGAALALVGKQGVHFLDANSTLRKQISFSKYIGCALEAVRLNENGEYGFLTRDQSWAVNVILFDKSGREVWNYPSGFMTGVDDSTAGEAEEGGNVTVVVGFNGGGGLVVVNAQGKKRWQKAESNVWHVETLDIKGDGHREILHTNARGELLVRNPTGEVVMHYLPGYYISHFSLTRWGKEPQPTHILVPTQRSKEGCCRNVLMVLDAAGNTLASMDAPEGDWIHRAIGTPVQQRGKAEAYAVLQTGLLPRSLLSVYNNEGTLKYQEVVSERCLAINTLAGELADRLLIGCSGRVWEYSPQI